MATMLGLASTLTYKDGPAKIPSHKIITQKKEEGQLSKRKLKKMKGKKNRKNRGRYRK